jgi:hypothetical protein
LSTAKATPYYYDYVFIKDIRRKTGNNSRAAGEVLCRSQSKAVAAHGCSAVGSAMGQKDGVLEERRSQKWTAAVNLQPTISKSDRLIGAFRKQKTTAKSVVLSSF